MLYQPLPQRCQAKVTQSIDRLFIHCVLRGGVNVAIFSSNPCVCRKLRTTRQRAISRFFDLSPLHRTSPRLYLHRQWRHHNQVDVHDKDEQEAVFCGWRANASPCDRTNLLTIFQGGLSWIRSKL